MSGEKAVADLTSSDATAIDAVLHGFADAWNRHDMTAFAKLFSEDAHWVNVVGMHWRGRDQVMKAHAAYHATIFKNNELHVLAFESRSIGPSTAVAVAKVSQSGFLRPDGATEPPRSAMMSVVLMNRGNGWLIVHGQNTVTDPAAAQFDPVVPRRDG